MPQEFSEDEIWEILGFIKVSPIRYQTILTLNTEFLMPSEIAKTTGYRTTQISAALNELKELNLVECKNESAKKGRLYKSTELGLEILKILEK
jgi:DNA-binding transcriptional regulator GbsR (MarR family)